MPQRALITGISGFAGGYLAEHLIECGDQVLGCSPNGAWEKASPEGLFDRVEVVAWNVGDSEGIPQESLRRIAAFRPDCIYHLAALSVPADCGRDEPVPLATAVNVDGTRRVLELAASFGWRPRVLFTSSSHVYAPVDSGSPQLREDTPLSPRTAYGRTKLAAEKEVRRAVAQGGCDAVIVRAFQHTGPRQSARMMLPQWAEQFARGGAEPIEVHTLDARIDLSDVRDVVRAYRLLAERGRSGEAYNVGSGHSRRTGDILDLLRDMADPDRPVVQRRPGFKQEPVADVTRLVQTTGWHAAVPLEQTVADTLAWWRQR
ncbi:MAG: NAD-dependent epimerase/dehydratase family protein [Planctomycetota bacterium]